MVYRPPVIRRNGKFQQLPAGDTIIKARGGDMLATTDCMNITTDLAPFVVAPVSNGSLVQSVSRAIVVNHPGVIAVTSGTNANSGARVVVTDTILEGGEQFDILFYMPANAGGTWSSRIGWSSASNATVTLSRGACIKMVGFTAVFETANAGGRTENASSYTMSSDTWYHARIKNATDGNTITAQLFNDATKAELWNVSNTTMLPTKANTDTMAVGYVGQQGAAPAFQGALIDMMQLYIPVNTTRGLFQ